MGALMEGGKLLPLPSVRKRKRNARTEREARARRGYFMVGSFVWTYAW